MALLLGLRPGLVRPKMAKLLSCVLGPRLYRVYRERGPARLPQNGDEAAEGSPASRESSWVSAVFNPPPRGGEVVSPDCLSLREFGRDHCLERGAVQGHAPFFLSGTFPVAGSGCPLGRYHDGGEGRNVSLRGRDGTFPVVASRCPLRRYHVGQERETLLPLTSFFYEPPK